MFGANKRWRDQTTTQKAGVVLLSTVQITLLVAALTDLRRRSADEINGSKPLWTALAFVNVIGPWPISSLGARGSDITQGAPIMAPPTQTAGRREQLPTLRGLSRSVAHVDVAVLLGTSILTGLAAVVARRVRTAPPFLAAGGALASALAIALRLGRRSGVADAEVRRALPGDDLIPDPGLVTDRAITIYAPAQDVWPWVVQMGYHRGGWYTSRWLDKLIWHLDNPSADRIMPQLQQLGVGDVVPDGPPGTARFTVAVLEPGRALVYLDDAGTHVPGTAFSWAFVLEPLDACTTRVHVRTRGAYPPKPLIALLSRLVIGPADFVMVSGQMLRGIKRRAEQAAKTSPQPAASSSD